MVGLLLELYLFLLLAASAQFLNNAQREGFISIDCGSAEGTSYTDEVTGITYTSDAGYIFTGENKGVSDSIKTPSDLFRSARTFPEGDRNCYTLKPVTKGVKYLVRADFLYDNYDGIEQIPSFDLYLGVNLWARTNHTIVRRGIAWTKEIITVAKNNFIAVCLVRRSGNPYISGLELRPLDADIYNGATSSQDLYLRVRADLGSPVSEPIARYPDDPYDRFYMPVIYSDFGDLWKIMNGTVTDTTDSNVYRLPKEVMSTAVAPSNGSALNFSRVGWPTSRYIIYAHVRELVMGLTEMNLVREFNACLQNIELSQTPTCMGPFRANYSSTITITININSSALHAGNDQYVYSLQRTAQSDLPPILNAFELYSVHQHTEVPTYENDLDAIMEVRSFYEIKKNWMGDPCVPARYIWEGLYCHTADIGQGPRIIYLNLSASRLQGSISPFMGNLSSLQSLDLSRNSLSGELPEFLATLQSLTLLNLSGNNLTGSVPPVLLEKWNNGSLQLSIDGNPGLCKSKSCNSSTKKKKPKLTIFILVSAAVVVIILGIVFGLWRKSRTGKQKIKGTGSTLSSSISLDNRRFTYAELREITNDFSHALGRGGFGTVYHGILKDGNQVAVKMISPNCSGSSEFQTEAQLLIQVHHKNLVRFIGYCCEGKNKALVLEYMPQGNLAKVLLDISDDNNVPLTWSQRLLIAQDIAVGLEYLHVGCKPPIIHRDVKLTNILLDDKFEAKIADFGISKVFYNYENCSHASTTDVKGTPGYVDPEYYVLQKLNEKSDVYGFGIILLELITGKPAIIQVSDDPNEDRISIVEWVRRYISQGDIRSILDPRLGGDWDTNSAWAAMELAIESCRARGMERPSMSDVVIQLKQCLYGLGKASNSRAGSCSHAEPGTDSMFLPSPR